MMAASALSFPYCTFEKEASDPSSRRHGAQMIPIVGAQELRQRPKGAAVSRSVLSCVEDRT